MNQASVSPAYPDAGARTVTYPPPHSANNPTLSYNTPGYSSQGWGPQVGPQPAGPQPAGPQPSGPQPQYAGGQPAGLYGVQPVGAPGVAQPVFIAIPPELMQRKFGREPEQARCKKCNQDVTTVTEYKIGRQNCNMCTLFLGLGALLPILWCLCWIPFIVKKWKDVIHKCPNCDATIGRHYIVDPNRIYYRRRRY